MKCSRNSKCSYRVPSICLFYNYVYHSNNELYYLFAALFLFCLIFFSKTLFIILNTERKIYLNLFRTKKNSISFTA